MFVVFHLDISGNFNRDLHSENILEISETFNVFHFEISGKLLINEHLRNNEFILLTL